MSLPVDLKNLREITDGDTEMERELFNEFISTSDEYIDTLGKSTSLDANEAWRAISHSFKGIALNLGAEKLGELCKTAQENNMSSAENKTAMLTAINQEYIAVRDYLKSL